VHDHRVCQQTIGCTVLRGDHGAVMSAITDLQAVMLVLGLGLVLKESLRTIFMSLALAFALELKSLSLALALNVKSLALALALALKLKSLALALQQVLVPVLECIFP